MSAEHNNKLSEDSVNIIENLACRIAELIGGRITPAHLLPFLPVSLDMINEGLNDMVDGSAVIEDREGSLIVYEFPACRNLNVDEAERKEGLPLLRRDRITSLLEHAHLAFSFSAFQNDISRMAEITGWPARAVYEHEFFYLASQIEGPVHAETLASRSRYTLKRTRKKLAVLCMKGYITEGLDEENGAVTYRFPGILYPKSIYQEHMNIIKKFPASVMEEVEIKIVRILLALSVLLVILFIMALLHFPFHFLMFIFIVSAPVISLIIWSKKNRPEE